MLSLPAVHSPRIPLYSKPVAVASETVALAVCRYSLKAAEEYIGSATATASLAMATAVGRLYLDEMAANILITGPRAGGLLKKR